MIGQGFGSEAIGQAVMECEARIKVLEEEMRKTAGLIKDALPERKKLRESAKKELNRFEFLIASSDVTIARKAIATLLTTPDGEFMPLKVGSKEPPESGKRCQPWRAKRRLVNLGSREGALLTRRAHSARGEAK